ncbi:MAG TPA: HlyD family efflux transporter periplasmic adaptor subunit [Kofleriaceae bacterium]|nr:HlyD family efflux transporter periplasmic adaptor subunit [Kofleriaceae bacterium]
MDRPKTRPRRLRRRLLWLAAGAAAILGITLGLSSLRAAAPVVSRGTVMIDTVRRGEMLRQVQAPGTLVPTDIRWITTETAARVERLRVEAGARVEPDTVLLELSNPDVQLRALEAEREMAQAHAQLAELEAGLDSQRLAQASQVATLEGELSDASRRAKATKQMHEEGAVPALERDEALGKAQILESRLAFERKRLGTVDRSRRAQLKAQAEQIGRLKNLVEFARRQVDNLQVKAGTAGVVQELPLQPGQMVQAGALLAKVVNPARLKAELRVPETQAKDVALGLPAMIDTRNGEVPGKVMRIDPAAQEGTVRVDVRLDGPLPPGARPDLTVDGTIQIERLADVLYVGRPAFGEANSRISLFKVVDGGDEAIRVPVQIGKSSARTVEIRSGLAVGDSVVLSDLAQLDDVERIRLQ